MSTSIDGSASPVEGGLNRALASLTRITIETKESFGVAGDLYSLQEVLGEGSYGSVYRCSRQKDQTTFAVKVINPMRIGFCGGADLIERIEQMAAQEVHALRQLSSHPGIITLEEAFFSETTHQIFIVTEFACGGDLFSHIVSRPHPLLEASVSHIVAQLSDALSFCHALGIVHRDLKLENVLVASLEVHLVADSSTDLPGSRSWKPLELITTKICDFGFAKSMKTYTTRTHIGSSEYAAPELGLTPPQGSPLSPCKVDHPEDYDAFKAEAFSLGVMTFVMLCHAFPDRESCRASNHNNRQWHALSPAAKSLLDGLLVLDPQTRFGIADVINHEWVKFVALEDVDVKTPTRMMRRLSETSHRQKIKSHLWAEGDWQGVVSYPASTLQDSIVGGLLAMHRTLVLVQQERGMACWALAGASGLDGISCWDQLRWHIQLSDKRLQEAIRMLQSDGSKLLKVDALDTLRFDLARARQLVLALAPYSKCQTDDTVGGKRSSSDGHEAFDSVFSAYNSACGKFVDVVAKALEAVWPDTSAVRKASRRYRLLSAAAEQLGRERAFVCGGVYIRANVDSTSCSGTCDRELRGAFTQASEGSDSSCGPRLHPERVRRLSEILGARKVLLGSATQGTDIVSISTGLLVTLLDDDEPSLLSQAEIGALEAIEEQVLSVDFQKAVPVDEWYRALTILVNGIHSRIAMALVGDVLALRSTLGYSPGGGIVAGAFSPDGRASLKLQGGLRGCVGCRSCLRQVLQTLLNWLS